MPYAKPRITRPLPRAAARIPWRRSVTEVGSRGSTVAVQLDSGNFAGRVYVAWDPPSTANPAWIEVTQFVQKDPGIVITRGRPDGESDPQVGTATMTVDDSDGRWSPTNPNGAWFGQIRKGCWLRVDVLPPSGVVSTRFVGFVQQLPVSWAGKYSMVQISASDRFVLLGNAPPYQTAITHEWLNDPVGSPYIAGYWPLHEPAASTYVSDVSGQAPANQSALTAYAHAVNPGNGIAFANTNAPGYDGVSTVTFTPIGTPIFSFFGAVGGALPNGSYLQGNVGPMGNVAQITVWVNTTVASQPVWSWADPTSNYSIGFMIDQQGFVQVFQGTLSGTSSTIAIIPSGQLSRYPVNDGVWHQVSIKLQSPAATSAGYGFIDVSVDGINTSSGFYVGTLATTLAPQPTVTRFTLAAAEGWINDGVSGTALFTGSLSDLVVHLLPSSASNIDWYGPYQAGTAMWQSPNAAYSVSESCGRRIIRLAQYAGAPVPTTSFVLPNFGAQMAQDVTPGVTPFVNIPTETAHPAGLQQLQGQQPLAAMQTAAHTENMPLFIDRQGRIVLQPSTLRQNPTPAFSINALDLDPSTQWADDFQYLQNQTVITPSGQGALTVNTNGTASQDLNGLYSDGLDTITINPLESGSLGAAINGAGANPAPRHNPLACEVATLATQPAPPLNPNPTFAANVTGWGQNGGTFTWSNAVLYPGQTGSGLITPNGTSGQDTAESTPEPVIAGQSYTVQGWVYSPTGYSAVGISINWYGGAAYSGYIFSGSGVVATQAVTVGAWTFITGTFTAPAGATYGTAFAIQKGTPPVTALLYLSQVALYDTSSIYGNAWYDAVLGAEISSVIQVANWPSQSPGGSSGSYYIEGYTETITAGNHLFAWNTSPAQGPTYQLDSPTLGLLDTPGITLAY